MKVKYTHNGFGCKNINDSFSGNGNDLFHY